jgi:two-component system phosphate regulon response regulator PhoB
MRVFIQRIKRLIERRRARQELPAGTISESQGVVIDRYRHRAAYPGQELPLTPTEYRLLEMMVKQPGRAFTRHELIEVGLGEDTVVLDRTVDVHIKSLREKLGDGGQMIETVRNIGYRFRGPRVAEP